MENEDAKYWLDKGNEFYDSGDLEEAVKCYAEATRLKPDYADAFNNWGNAIFNLANIKQDDDLFLESCEKYSEATRLNPDDASTFYNWGNAIYNLAKINRNESLFRESFEKYIEATRLNPDFALAFNNWGNAISELAKIKQDELLFRESFDKYAEATRLKPDYAFAFGNWGTAIYGLAEIKQDESLFRESIDKYTEATRLNPDYAGAFHNLGNAICELAKIKQDESLFRESINKYTQAIDINNELVDAYYGRSVVYNLLEKYSDKFSDRNACLYWSIKQKKTDYTRGLLNTFEEYPQNILTIYEGLGLDTTPLLFNDYYLSATSKISDFKQLIAFFEISIRDPWMLLSVKAILNYYLGGPVSSFLIFDEQLDDDKHALTSRELYYYAKAADDINVEKVAILEDAIDQLEAKEKDSTDLYYLGHLYLMAKDEAQAKSCFRQSDDFIFSKIMLCYLEGKDSIEQNIIAELQSLNLQGEIKSERDEELYGFEIKDLSQFRDYFHVSECKEALSELDIFLPSYEPLLWKAFQLSDTAKISIDGQLRKFTCDELKAKVLEQWKHQMKDSSEEEKNEKMDVLLKYITIIRKHENEGDDKVEKVFSDIEKDATSIGKSNKHLSNYEEIMYLCIKTPALTAKDYLSFLLYYFIDEKITAEETFHLLLYLKHKMDDTFYPDYKNLKEQVVGILPDMIDDRFLKLIKIGYALYHTLYGNTEEKSESVLAFGKYQLNPDEYTRFKENCWRLILMEYNVLGEEKFYKQYELRIVETSVPC